MELGSPTRSTWCRVLFPSAPVSVAALAEQIKREGKLIGDRDVVEAVLEAMLDNLFTYVSLSTLVEWICGPPGVLLLTTRCLMSWSVGQ
jgi:hypothetical protein